MASTFAGDIWSKIELDLSEFRDVFSARLETKREAIGERIAPGNRETGKKARWHDTAPRWEDEEHGTFVRPWLMLPYVDALEPDSLLERLEAGKRLLSSVETRVAVRELSLELLHEWGLLSRWAGALQLISEARPDVGRQREGVDNLDRHKRWFADYFLRVYRRGQLHEARDVMERFINAMIEKSPPGIERSWFERFLSDKPSDYLEDARRLTDAFREDLSVAQMRRLIKQPANNLPPLDLEFPPP